MATTETFIGQPVLRKEDAKLLAGQGSFIDNLTMAGMVWMALVRPPYVHATIDAIDTRRGGGDAGRRRRLHRRPTSGDWAAGCRWCGPSPRTSRSRRTTR